MQQYLLFLIALLIILGLPIPRVQASHLYAGHISYVEIGPLTYEITLVTYSDPSVASVDRCTADLEIWDGNGSAKISEILDIPRSNGPLNMDSLFPVLVTCPGQGMGNYVRRTLKRNEYTTSFTLSNPGNFLIRYSDLARLANMNNMINSASQAFFVETKLVSNTLLGPQNSVRLLNHQVDAACIGREWTFNPGCYDFDGDVLEFEFIPPRQYAPPSIPAPITCTGYIKPGSIPGTPPMVMDSATGLITWIPSMQGIYTFAVSIREFRDGQEVGFTVYDQVVSVGGCANQPPEILCITDTIVMQGDTLNIPFLAWDPDPLDTLTFMLNNAGLGLNGAFSQTPPPVITFDPPGMVPYQSTDTIRGNIEWILDNSVSVGFPHQIDLYAVDNYSYLDSIGLEQLSRHHAIRILVEQPVGTFAPLEPLFQFELWPNPSPGHFEIKVAGHSPYYIQVLSLTGKLLLEQQANASIVQVNTEGLEPGLYFVRVRTRGGQEAVRKLVLKR